MTSSSSWTRGVVPTTADVATFAGDLPSTGIIHTGTNVNFGGLAFNTTYKSILITGNAILTLGSKGVYPSTDNTGSNYGQTISIPTTLSAAETWRTGTMTIPSEFCFQNLYLPQYAPYPLCIFNAFNVIRLRRSFEHGFDRGNRRPNSSASHA